MYVETTYIRRVTSSTADNPRQRILQRRGETDWPSPDLTKPARIGPFQLRNRRHLRSPQCRDTHPATEELSCELGQRRGLTKAFEHQQSFALSSYPQILIVIQMISIVSTDYTEAIHSSILRYDRERKKGERRDGALIHERETVPNEPLTFSKRKV